MQAILRKVAMLAGLVTVLGLATAVPAGATANVTVTPNPVPVTNGQATATVTVDWAFGASNTAIFVDLCKKQTSDPTFDYTLDCDRGVANAFNGSSSGAGSQQVEIPIGDSAGSQIFGDPLDQWGCYPQGFQPSQGFEQASQCYIRVTQTQVDNNSDAVDVPLNYEVGGNEIPEAPLVILPVLLGATAVGGFLFFNRRRAFA